MPSKEEVLMLVHHLDSFVEKFHNEVILEDEDDIGRYDYVIKLLAKELEFHMKEYKGITVHVYNEHGELRHTPAINSKYWVIQVKWLCMEYYGYRIYIDPVSSQFRHLLPDIPDWYVSLKKPKWYLSNGRNIGYSKIGIRINKKLRVFTTIHGQKCRVGLIEWLQYKVWATVSDVLNTIFHKRR